MVAVLPAFSGLTFPISRTGPIFDTVVQDAIGGKQTAFSKRVTPKWTWELPYEFLMISAGDKDTLAGFHASCFGRANAFGYTDPNDSVATNQSFGVGDGISVSFPLVRALGGFVEPVNLPTGSIAIAVGGVATTTYTLLGGVVTFVTAPALGATLAWSGTFNWLCRFDDDSLQFSQVNGVYWELKKLSFTSVIP